MKKVNTDDCMLWAVCTSDRGYARTSIKDPLTGKQKTVYAHREIYLAEKGSIPEGYVLDHLCRNRNCVNSDHLEPVTNRENISRGDRPKPYGDHCNNGHPITENSYWLANGSKRCKECKREWSRANKHMWNVYRERWLQKKRQVCSSN